MLPIAQNARTLTVAANDPLNYYAIEDIRQLTGMEPEIVLAELEPCAAPSATITPRSAPARPPAPPMTATWPPPRPRI